MVHPYPTAEVNECIRRFPEVALSGLSGFCGRPRTSVALGVGSSGASQPERRCGLELLTGFSW